MRIVLPFPDARLNPNARIHWRPKSQAVKQARWDASYSVLQAAGGSLAAIRSELADRKDIPLRVVFYPPDRHHRDDDNMVGAFKSYRDGIADALGVNDRRFRPTYEFADSERPGKVVVEVG